VCVKINTNNSLIGFLYIKYFRQTVIKSQKETIDNDPYQQRTETVIEFVRRRRF
jgi:hypothetical protein